MSYVRYLRSSESRHYCKKKTHITTASLNSRIPREWNCAIFIFNLQYYSRDFTTEPQHTTMSWAEENKPKTWIIWRCVDLYFIISWSLSCGRSLDESASLHRHHPPFFFHLIFSFFSILVVEVAQRSRHPSCQPQQQSKRRKSNFLRIYSLTRFFFTVNDGNFLLKLWPNGALATRRVVVLLLGLMNQSKVKEKIPQTVLRWRWWWSRSFEGENTESKKLLLLPVFILDSYQ